ncbi:hypothetical protein N494_18165 (plasmid) [Clostridium botulinum A2B7 92]|uniref:hypothetical protein n=1 Tax=Clostridium botulinum TaxID=1491 RepID=UPI0007DE650C|nr:hypothetical protein [Clostridium botulinum]KEI94051.1 hypothetical protein N494_18165 [Clostridium botulinum A2B7 92]
MPIEQQLIQVEYKIIEILSYGQSNHVVRVKDIFNIEIGQIGVDDHECWCDGDIIKRVSIFY